MKIYKLQGLDCPNCAKKLEKEINKLESIKSAEIDFLKGKIKLDFNNEDEAIKDVKKVILAVEPQARIITKEKDKKVNLLLIIDFIALIVGAVLGVCVLFVKMPTSVFWILYVISVLMFGYKTFYKALRLLLKGTINENILITIAVVGATCLGEYREGLMVIFLYAIGKLLENLALNKSKKSIEAITALTPEFVTVVKDGEEKIVKPEDVELDSVIIVKAGERVCIDGIIIDGSSSINTQSITGESVPICACVGEEILSGTIVIDGVLKIKTTKVFVNSTISRIMNLIENANEKKSKTETVVSKLAKWYTLGVLALAFCVFGIVWIITTNLDIAVYRGLIFLMVSCPCAFAISVPLTYFSGLGCASKNGILIKGSNYLDNCSKINVVAFDKTGTLTTGEFEVAEVTINAEKFSKEDVLYFASLGEQNSKHPLAKAILNENKKELLQVENFKEDAGKGIRFIFNEKEYFVGRKNNLVGTKVEVYENDIKIGEITLKDKIKFSSYDAIKNLNKIKVKTVLLSGDNEDVVSEVARKIKINESHSNMVPQDKYEWILNAKKNKNVVIGFVGDGINDSPSVAVSDVGFSMGINGSSASIDASDIVLVDDNPNKVATAIKISKHTKSIVWQNIIFASVVKVLFLLLGTIGITGMLEAVIADVGVTVVAILNSLRALKIKNNKKKVDHCEDEFHIHNCSNEHNNEKQCCCMNERTHLHKHNEEHNEKCCCSHESVHMHKHKKECCSHESEHMHEHKEDCCCEHKHEHKNHEHNDKKCCCSSHENDK